MSFTHVDFLSSQRIFGCKGCKYPLSIVECLISRRFNAAHGPGYLFDRIDLNNIKFAPPGNLHMTTGLHTTRAVSCARCEIVLGWKYVSV